MRFTWRGEPFDLVKIEGGQVFGGHVGLDLVHASTLGLEGTQHGGFHGRFPLDEVELPLVVPLSPGSHDDLVVLWRGREVDLGFVRDDELTVFHTGRAWAEENGMQHHNGYIYFAIVSPDDVMGPYRKEKKR